jgi:hypothetical protein
MGFLKKFITEQFFFEEYNINKFFEKTRTKNNQKLEE